MTRSSEGDILRQGSSSVMPSKVQILSLHHLQSWVSFLCHNMAAVSPSIVSTSTAEGGAWAKGRLAESTHLSLESQNFPQKLSLCFLWWDLGHTVLLPGKSHGRRSLVGCSPWGRWGSDMTEQLHLHSSLSCIGEGNGSPLQCSCLEDPRDRGAWWAAVYGVTQSQTRLKRLSSSSSSRSHSHFPINYWPKVWRFCYPARTCHLTHIEANTMAWAFEKERFITRWREKETGGKTLKPASLIQGSGWFLRY